MVANNAATIPRIATSEPLAERLLAAPVLMPVFEEAELALAGAEDVWEAAPLLLLTDPAADADAA